MLSALELPSTPDVGPVFWLSFETSVYMGDTENGLSETIFMAASIDLHSTVRVPHTERDGEKMDLKGIVALPVGALTSESGLPGEDWGVSV